MFSPRTEKKITHWLLGGALLFGGYKLMGPDKSFDATKAYEPNDVQRQFIRDAAKKFNYVAFGDENHTKPEIQMFALSDRTVSALAESGVKNFYLEQSPDHQAYFNALAEHRSVPADMAQQDGIANNNMWLCGAAEKDRLNQTLEHSAGDNSSLRFIGADNRQVADPFAAMTKAERVQTDVFFVGPLIASEVIYGCVSPNMLIPGGIVMHLTGADKGLMDGITDDRPTAARMQEPGAILFGAGHFQEIGSEGDKTSMRGLLTKDGKTMAVFDVFANAADAESEKVKIWDGVDSDGKAVVRPDAILYVTPPPGNPDGIEIINPKLQPLYDAAKKAVAHEKAPAPRPTV